MMHGKLRKFLALSWKERFLLLQAVILLVPVAGMLRLFGLKSTLGRLGRQLPPCVAIDEVSDERLDEARRLAKLVGIAAGRVPVNTTCLRQSIVLWWLLRRRALPAALRLGVNRTDGFQAHAWVELGGVVINDSDSVRERFTPLEDTTGLGA